MTTVGRLATAIAAIIVLVGGVGVVPALATGGESSTPPTATTTLPTSADVTANLALATGDAGVMKLTPLRPRGNAAGASIVSSGVISAPRALDDVAASTPVGRSGLAGELNVVSRNSPATIGGRSYTGHALDRMQGHGLVPSVLEDAIVHGQRVSSRGGTSIFYSAENNISVVLSRDGRVVTVGYGQFKP